jgi:hypothetical protein
MPSLCTELRSNRLNRSEMNKIVRSWSITPCSIDRSKLRVRICNSGVDFTPRCLAADKPLGSSVCMTAYLIAMRAAIVLWTSLAVMPAEIVFDVIEAELERRDVEP